MAYSTFAEVSAQNLANEQAEKLQTAFVSLFASLHGKKVQKKTGGLLASVCDQINELTAKIEKVDGVRFWIDAGNYSVWVRVKACYNHEGQGYYKEDSVYLGSLRDGILDFVPGEPNDFSRRYTVEEVERARETLRQAAETYREAESALRCFDARGCGLR
jgi:hypothetical protein